MTSYPIPGRDTVEIIDIYSMFQDSTFQKELFSTYEKMFVKTSFTYKCGKAVGKTVKFGKTTEAKAAALLATWSLETVSFALTVYLAYLVGAHITAALFVAFYLYSTYALFAVLANQKN
jgi:hypothetical protein